MLFLSEYLWLVSDKPAGWQYNYNELKSIASGYYDVRMKREKVQEKYSPNLIIPNILSCQEIQGKNTNFMI